MQGQASTGDPQAKGCDSLRQQCRGTYDAEWTSPAGSCHPSDAHWPRMLQDLLPDGRMHLPEGRLPLVRPQSLFVRPRCLPSHAHMQPDAILPTRQSASWITAMSLSSFCISPDLLWVSPLSRCLD